MANAITTSANVQLYKMIYRKRNTCKFIRNTKCVAIKKNPSSIYGFSLLQPLLPLAGDATEVNQNERQMNLDLVVCFFVLLVCACVHIVLISLFAMNRCAED